MKSKRVHRDEKLTEILSYYMGEDWEECYDLLMKRVRAMGPKDEHCDFGKTYSKVHQDYDAGWNAANAEWRRRLGGIV